MAGRWKRSRDDAGSMLATVIVIAGGAGLCSFMCLMDTSAFGDWMLALVVGGSLLAIGLIVRYRYSRNSSGGLGFWHMLHRNSNDDGIAAQYRPALVRDKQSLASDGNNTPITADQAREIRITSSNTWVPSRAVIRDDYGHKR